MIKKYWNPRVSKIPASTPMYKLYDIALNNPSRTNGVSILKIICILF